jgi:sterol desaturase/sphingolipid hydroxylase (fatty acid hydroxylase superfamily)
MNYDTLTPQPQFGPQPPKDETSSDGSKTILIISTIFLVLWVFAGIAAFLMSLLCFGKSGTTAQHVVGFLLAIFFGPFYWIYYFVAASYCRGKKGKKFLA